jgi:hypothetical protein
MDIRNKKTARPPKPEASILWQLEDANFERGDWWMKFGGEGKRAKLNSAAPELDGGKDERGRRELRHAPIIWEVLRRHPTIRDIRSEFAAFVAPAPLHNLILTKECRELFFREGFEIELILMVAGLNAWSSARPFPDDPVVSGTWPLETFPKQRFTDLESCYRYLFPPKEGLMVSSPAIDLTGDAKSLAESLE